jgi:peptidoglycan/LPS O-acetylase OafA/YrhL
VFSHSTRIRGWIPYRIVAAIGVYSYGIYLYHNSVRGPSLKLASHLPAFLQWPGVWLIQGVAAVLLGAAMTRIVEWPFLRYRDRILPQRVADIESVKEEPVGNPPAVEVEA